MDSNSPPAPIRSFYKIVLPSIITDNKLRIPEDFAKIYENELSSFATLVVPNGRIFRIKLERVEKMLWFHNGWKEFAEHHSIRCGFLLVFDYEGDSNFKVHIFDLTATEIEYPENTLGTGGKPKSRSKNSVLGKRGRKSTVSSQDIIFNECPLRGINRKRCLHSVLPTLFQFAPELAMKINKHEKCVSKLFFDSLRSNRQYQTRNKRHKMGDLGEKTSLKDVDTPERTSKAIVAFNSPVKYESEELLADNHDNLVEKSKFAIESVLQNDALGADKEDDHFPKDTQLTTPILKDEHLVKVKQEVEEVCTGVNESNIFPIRSIIQDKESAVSAALMLKLKNPYFMSILKKQNVDLSYILNVPAYFGNKNLSSETHFLKLEGPDGKHLQVSCFSDGKVQYLSRGWVAFVKEYKLVEGDVCIFELIQVDDEVLKVHIFRAHQTSW